MGQGRWHQSFLIDSDPTHTGAIRREDLARPAIVRIFENDRVACFEQDTRGEGKGLLCSRDDEDVFRRGAHATPAREIVADLAAQGRQALRIGVVEFGAIGGTTDLAAPGTGECGIRQRQPVLQVVTQIKMLTSGNPCAIVEDEGASGEIGKWRDQVDVTGFVNRHAAVSDFGDKASSADPTDQESLGLQLVVSRNDRVARNPEFAGERTAGRYACTCSDS